MEASYIKLFEDCFSLPILAQLLELYNKRYNND